MLLSTYIATTVVLDTNQGDASGSSMKRNKIHVHSHI